MQCVIKVIKCNGLIDVEFYSLLSELRNYGGMFLPPLLR